MKKKTLIGLLIGVTVVAAAASVIAVEAETNIISSWFEEEHISNGNVVVDLSSLVAEKTTEKETLKQEITINDETSPFEKIELNYQLYGSEKKPASITKMTDSNALVLDYVSEVEIKFELKEDVEFYVSSLAFLGGYLDEEGQLLTEDHLDIEVKIGSKKLKEYTSSTTTLFVEDNAYSNDIVMTIKNVLAEEGEPATFTIGALTFNHLDRDAWVPAVDEEVEE